MRSADQTHDITKDMLLCQRNVSKNCFRVSSRFIAEAIFRSYLFVGM